MAHAFRSHLFLSILRVAAKVKHTGKERVAAYLIFVATLKQ